MDVQRKKRFCGWASLLSRLLLSHIPNHRQLEHLSLIGFKHQNQPDHKANQTDQRPDQEGSPSKKRNVGKDRQTDPKHRPSYPEEEALKGVESDKALPVERFDHQKHNCRNDRHIGERARYVIGKSRAGWNGQRAARRPGTLGTGCSIRDLRPARWTKSHKASLEMTGKVSEPLPGRNGVAANCFAINPSPAGHCRSTTVPMWRLALAFLIDSSLIVISRYINSLVYSADCLSGA